MASLARYPSLVDRVVLITGGSTGIGETLVEQFVAQGARVGFVDIDVPNAEALVKRLTPGAKTPPLFVQADITDIAKLEAAIDMQPIIATLILMVAGRGIAQLITNGQIITVYYAPYFTIGNGFLLGLPFAVFIAAAVWVVLHLLMTRTALGLFIQTIGINPAAARMPALRRHPEERHHLVRAGARTRGDRAGDARCERGRCASRHRQHLAGVPRSGRGSGGARCRSARRDHQQPADADGSAGRRADARRDRRAVAAAVRVKRARSARAA